MDKSIEISVNKYLDSLIYLDNIVDKAIKYIKEDKQKNEIKSFMMGESRNSILDNLKKMEENSARKDEYFDYLIRTSNSLKSTIDFIERLLTNSLSEKLYVNLISNACLIMEQLSLPINDRFNVLLFLFNQDLEQIIDCKNGYDINFENLITWEFKYTNANEIIYMEQKNEIKDYLNKKFSGEKELKQKEIRDYINKNKVELKNILEAQKEIKKHYLDKNGEINGDDIDHIANALTMAYVNKELVDIIKNLLQKKLKKEEPEIRVDYDKAQDKYKEKEEEKEKLRKELSNYIDLRTMQPTHTLTIGEVNRVLYILKFLKYDMGSIKEFLTANELNLKTMDTISKYKYLQSRFEYYKEKYGLIQVVKDLNDYYNEFEDSTNDDDKKFYKNCLKDGIEFILKNIPTTFEYELRSV